SVLLVPKRQRPAEDLIAIAKTGDAILAPSEDFRPGQVVREVAPRIAVPAVVLAHRAPSAVGQIRPPFPPAGDVVRRAGHAGAFRGHRAHQGLTIGDTPDVLPSRPRRSLGRCR